METNLDQWTADTIAHIEQSCRSGLEAAAKDAAELVRKHTDANRQETRKAVRSQMKGQTTAIVGLFFPQQFSNVANTYTARTFRTIWEDTVTPRIRERLVTRLNERLQK
jgi:hypothetical protein